MHYNPKQTKERHSSQVTIFSFVQWVLTASNCQHRNQGATEKKKGKQICWAEQAQRLHIHSLLLLQQMHPNPFPIWTATSPDSWVSTIFLLIYPIVPVLGMWVLDGILAPTGSLTGLEWRVLLFVLLLSHFKMLMNSLIQLRPSFSIVMVSSFLLPFLHTVFLHPNYRTRLVVVNGGSLPFWLVFFWFLFKYSCNQFSWPSTLA